MNFKILKKSRISGARLGFIETSRGVIETPCFVPVATQAVVKTLDSHEVERTNSQILICNTFWLHLSGRDEVIKKVGGLHKFMNWKKPLMTDSGGFQVFSLGFGSDFGVGKILTRKNKEGNASANNLKKYETKTPFTNYMELVNDKHGKIKREKGDEPEKSESEEIKHGSQPKNLKIMQDGVYFSSPINGEKLFLGPKESIKIQENLGAEIIFAFDECTPPLVDYEYTKKSLETTHKWAKTCLDAKKSRQALFGIVQGGRFKDLRVESAKFIGSLDFEGFGIGGELGDDKKQMSKMLRWVIDELPEKKPRHLLGIGYLEDIKKIVKSGVDLFDCIVPTHYARRGIVFGSEGKLNLYQAKFLKKREPLDKNCVCEVCLNYKKDYICHLLRSKELTAFNLITFHNLTYFSNFVEEIRGKIKRGEI